MLEQLYQEFPNDVRIVFRHYPLIGTPEEPFHDKAAITAQAAEAAGRQDKFWEMHDVILARQAEWVNMTPDEFQSWVVERAEELSLNTDTFVSDMQDPEIVAKIQEAWEHGKLIQIPRTPFLLVNGNPWPTSVPMDYWSIAAVTKLTLLEQIQFTTCPAMSIDPLVEASQFILIGHNGSRDLAKVGLQDLPGLAPRTAKLTQVCLGLLQLGLEQVYHHPVFHLVYIDQPVRSLHGS